MKKEFDPLQEKEITLGYEHGLEKNEVRIYAKKRFHHLQMQEIRLGFEYGLTKREVRKYAHPWIPNEKMKEVREHIQLGDREGIPIIMPGGFSRGVVLYGVMVGIVLLSSFIYLGKTIFHKPLILELTSEKIELDGSTPFLPTHYIKEYTEENTQLILPESIDFRIPGERVVLYKLVGEKESITKLLHIQIMDDQEPILTLTSQKITLVEGEPFDCRVYIDEAYDEINGDLRDRVDCSNDLTYGLEEQIIQYRLVDKAGNMVEEELLVELVPDITQS